MIQEQASSLSLTTRAIYKGSAQAKELTRGTCSSYVAGRTWERQRKVLPHLPAGRRGEAAVLLDVSPTIERARLLADICTSSINSTTRAAQAARLQTWKESMRQADRMRSTWVRHQPHVRTTAIMETPYRQDDQHRRAAGGHRAGVDS